MSCIQDDWTNCFEEGAKARKLVEKNLEEGDIQIVSACPWKC
jgi:hypothetical protein